MVKHIIKILGLHKDEVLFMAYTAKAALRLQLEGLNASTIHSICYIPILSNDGTLSFMRRAKLNSKILLLIVDEAGMVGEYMIKDLIRFNVPLIMLGDPAQLPPIMAKPNPYMKDDQLDGFLDEAMRYDDSTGILTAATLARQKKPISYGNIKETRIVHLNTIRNELNDFDIVLCYKNTTRIYFNKEIRAIRGYDKYYPYPKKGEKIVGLYNNYNHYVVYKGIRIFFVNGLTGIMVEDSYIDKETGYLKVKFIPDFIPEIKDEYCFDLYVHPEYFLYMYDYNVVLPSPFEKNLIDKNNKNTDELINKDLICYMTFGYCLTVSKFQGSSASNCLVILDDYPMNHPHYSNYLYTAITRAEQKLTLASFK